MLTRFEVEFQTINSAFEPPEPEIARILRDIADKVEAGNSQGSGIRDVNGNPVGGWFVYHEE